VSRAERATHREGNEVEFSRIVAFSDGVFAIAITLLVLSLEVPAHLHGESVWEALWEQREGLLAYALSFAVIGRFWVVHHRFFSDVLRFDGRLLALNLFYLAWIVLIPFSSEVLGDHGRTVPAVVLYAVNLAGATLVGLLLTSDARRHGLVRPDPVGGREGAVRATYIAGVFLVSIPVAFLTPTYAPLVWLALFYDPAARLSRDAPGTRSSGPGARS
jgi:uncharacterized membrane protein